MRPRFDVERLETLKGQYIDRMRRRGESPGRAASLLLGLGFLLFAARFVRNESAATARQLFLASLLYMPALLALLALDRIPL